MRTTSKINFLLLLYYKLERENDNFKLFCAIYIKRETLYLLSTGADPNKIFKQHGGVSPFHIAVGLENDLIFTKLFLSYNANVHLK